MNNRLRLVSAVTLVVAIVLVALAAVAFKSPTQRSEIRAADRVAALFDTSVEQYAASMARNVTDKHPTTKKDLQELLSYIDGRIAKAPVVSTKGTTPYGRAHSHRYETAMARQKLALKPYRSLSTYLTKQALPAFTFAGAGIKLVQVNPGKLLGTTPVYTGAPLRDLVLPAFEKARDKVAKQPVPADSELLSLDLKTYADDIISMTKDGAKKIDAGKPFQFSFGTRPQDLYKRLIDLKSGILAELASRVDSLTPVS